MNVKKFSNDKNALSKKQSVNEIINGGGRIGFEKDIYFA